MLLAQLVLAFNRDVYTQAGYSMLVCTSRELTREFGEVDLGPQRVPPVGVACAFGVEA
jgi:hypothetical protein